MNQHVVDLAAKVRAGVITLEDALVEMSYRTIGWRVALGKVAATGNPPATAPVNPPPKTP